MRLLYFLMGICFLFYSFNDATFAKHKGSSNKSRRIVYAAPLIVGAPQLGDEVNRLIYSVKPQADMGLYVKSMKYNDTLYTKSTNQPLVPASILKIFTAEAALLYLGPDYHFTTQVFTDATSVNNGILNGNLYIVLTGDPSLTYYDLVDLLINLRTQQIQAIAGNVYIDNTAYDQSFYGPGWEGKDKNYCYAAPISASIVNHNCLSFKMTPAKVPGRFAQVVTYPKYFYPTIKNSVVTKKSRSRCGLRLTSDLPGVITIDGCMAKGRYAWGMSYVVTDIPDYNRSLFKSLFNRLSISVYGSVTFGSATGNLSLVATHRSKPLRLLINDMLKKSDNVIAGALFKKMGQLFARQPGSWENGSLAVTQILSRYTRMDTRGMRIMDGSGLSRDNMATAAQMMQVLDFAFHHYATNYEFISALPISGVDGTLKHRLGNITRKVRAKTGTMSGVVSLAGYVVNADKEPFAFVMIINGNPGFGWRYRELEDKIVTSLTRYRRSG